MIDCVINCNASLIFAWCWFLICKARLFFSLKVWLHTLHAKNLTSPWKIAMCLFLLLLLEILFSQISHLNFSVIFSDDSISKTNTILSKSNKSNRHILIFYFPMLNCWVVLNSILPAEYICINWTQLVELFPSVFPQ